MPFAYHYHAESNCLYVKGTGSVTLEDFLDHHRNLTIEKVPSTLLIISDYRDLDPSGLTATDIEEIRLSALGKMGSRIQRVKEAIVVSDALAYGLSRMFDGLVYADTYDMNVFHDLGDAKAWLGLADDTVLELPRPKGLPTHGTAGTSEGP